MSATLAWIGGLAAVALSLWLVWRAQRPTPPSTPVLQPAPAAVPAGPTAAGTIASPAPAASSAAANEVTHKEKRALEDVLRRKGADAKR